MIKYSEDLFIDEHMEFKLGKEKNKLLEKTLRLVGNFDKNKPIIIYDYEAQSFRNIVFKVKDKNNTTFSFLNYGHSDLNDKTDNRYDKNFHVTMQRENSNIIYKYDFSHLKFKSDFLNLIELIEISYNISENKVIKLHRGRNRSLNIKVETDNKKYTIVIANNSRNNSIIDNDDIMVENIEKIIREIINLDEINLEKLMKIIEKLVPISRCYIDTEKEKSSIDFLNSEIESYKVTKQNSSIYTRFYDDKIIRETERTLSDEVIKNKEIYTDENYEVVQSDIKQLMKRM